MPAQPTSPQPNADDIRIPRKRQARLDDNGEPAGVPASKKMRSAEENRQKKKIPAKTRPEKQRNTSKTVQQKTSVEIGVTKDSHDTRNGTQEPSELVDVESSDDEADAIEIPEEPEEDDEAQLGVYLLSNKIVSC
jgi:hypothetical protein